MRYHTILAINRSICAVVAQKASDTALNAPLPPQLLSVLPECARACTSAALTKEFTTIPCSLDDLECLCSVYSEDGYTFGEQAFRCLYQKPCTTSDRTNADFIYRICSHIDITVPPTVSTIVTATHDPTSAISLSRSSGQGRMIPGRINLLRRLSPQQSIVPTTAQDLSAASSSVPALSILRAADPTPLSEAQVAGIAIASIALVVLTVGMTGCFLFFRKRRQQVQQLKAKEDFYTHHQSSGTRQILSWYPIDPRGGNGGVGIQPLPRSPTVVTPPPPVYDRRWPRYYGISPEEQDIGIARTVDVPIVMAASPVAGTFCPDDIRPPAVPPKAAERESHRVISPGPIHSPKEIMDPFRTPERKHDLPSLSGPSPDANTALNFSSRSLGPASSQSEPRRASKLRLDIPVFGLDLSDPVAFADPRPAPPRPKQSPSMVISPEIRALINRSRQGGVQPDDRRAHTNLTGGYASGDRQQQRPPLEILRQQRAGPLAKLEEAREARVARKAEQALQSGLSSNVPSSDVLPAGAMRDELQATPIQQHTQFSRLSAKSRDRDSGASLTSFDSSTGTSSCYDGDDDVGVEKSIETTLGGQSPISNLRYPEIPRSVSPQQVPYTNTLPQLLFTLDEVSPVDRNDGGGKAIEDQFWRTEPSPIRRRPVYYKAYRPRPRADGPAGDVSSIISRTRDGRDSSIATTDASVIHPSRRNNASIIYQMPQLTPTRKGDDLFLSVS